MNIYCVSAVYSGEECGGKSLQRCTARVWRAGWEKHQTSHSGGHVPVI